MLAAMKTPPSNMKATIAPWFPAFACLVMALILSFGSKSFDRLAVAFTILTSYFVVSANITIRMRREMGQLQKRLSELEQKPNASALNIG